MGFQARCAGRGLDRRHDGATGPGERQLYLLRVVVAGSGLEEGALSGRPIYPEQIARSRGPSGATWLYDWPRGGGLPESSRGRSRAQIWRSAALSTDVCHVYLRLLQRPDRFVSVPDEPF